MNRRNFLAWLGGTAAGYAASQVWDIERMLWVPCQKTLFVPAGRREAYITMEWVVKDVLRELQGRPAIFHNPWALAQQSTLRIGQPWAG